MLRRTLIVAMVVAVLAGGAGGAAVGYARAKATAITEPNAKGLIALCYDTSSGKPRMINSGTRCARGEKKLTWTRHPPAPVVHEVGTPGEPAYTGGWAGYQGPPFGNLSFYKDATGIVHLTGLTCYSNGAAGCTKVSTSSGTYPIFTLPAGFRPPHQQVFSALSFGDGQYYSARVDVTTDGVVQLEAPPTAGGAWISFDGISFLIG
jgi:hypothetical protein